MLHFFWCGYNFSERCLEQYEFSNYEIAKWAEYYLSQKITFHQSRWNAGRVTENPNDILLGHLTWDDRAAETRSVMGELVHDWMRDNTLSPLQDIHPNTYVLTPWVPEFPPEWTVHMPFYERQLLAASKIFAICDKFWIKKTFEKQDTSIETRVRDKIIHSNMGVAAQNFPIKKQYFNEIGSRQLLHISNLAPYKGFDITCKSLQGVDTLLHVASNSLNVECGLVELSIDGETYVMNYLGNIDNNDQEFNQWVVENCDFYIHTAYMDAQPTTILENCARGLIPLITPESGFSSPHAIYLTHNPEENRAIIQQALELPESELLQRSHSLQEQIKQEHNWEGIFNHILREILIDIEQRQLLNHG